MGSAGSLAVHVPLALGIATGVVRLTTWTFRSPGTPLTGLARQDGRRRTGTTDAAARIGAGRVA
jgi:hypothetical protein